MLWLEKIFRMLFITIDTVVFHCVSLVYQLFMLLAETGIFKTEDIRNFADRMYFFLGLIMIFKVSTSIIQFIMNPDATKDSKIGAPKLLKNIVIILVGIVMIPYVFEAAFSLQRIVLQDNVIGSLILGMNYSSTGEAEDMVKDAGKRMEFDTFTAFFHFDTSYVSDACATNPYDFTGSTATVSEACRNDPNFDVINSFFESSAGNLYKRAYENKSVGLITDDVIYNYTVKDSDGKNQFLFSYLMIVTTFAGGFLVYILLLFCFDVAVRSVKLGFLQLIAPIPLISKIDPKKGDEVFSKWVKECVSTYLSLFLRLVSIYFAIFIISLIGGGLFNVIEPERTVSNPLVKVFIIFGTLSFVKELPKLIETITGLKLGDGKGSMNLAKRLTGVPLAGALMGNTARKAAGGIAAKRNGYGFKNGWNKAKQNDKGMLADFRKFRENVNPYGANVRKTRNENREKAAALDKKLANGKKTFEEVDAALGKVDTTGKSGYEIQKAKNQAKANTLFGEGSKNMPLNSAYTNMADAKLARDEAASRYEELSRQYQSGEITDSEAVNTARVNSLKAEANYKDKNTIFETTLNASPKQKARYEEYETYENSTKQANVDKWAQGPKVEATPRKSDEQQMQDMASMVAKAVHDEFKGNKKKNKRKV